MAVKPLNESEAKIFLQPGNYFGSSKYTTEMNSSFLGAI